MQNVVDKMYALFEINGWEGKKNPVFGRSYTLHSEELNYKSMLYAECTF